jgi:ectoine hydroxylase-related dioxygenase (phytanoyl-CoA dioxygenase family)
MAVQTQQADSSDSPAAQRYDLSATLRANCNLDDLRKLTAQPTSPEYVPLAQRVNQRIPIYSGTAIHDKINDGAYIEALLTEWNQVFDSGPGVVVVSQAYPDASVIDATTDVLRSIIAEEAEQSASSGDHFAAAGANSRVWNAHEKLAMANPQVFASYYANPILHLASRAWLGPAYEITAQVNVVHPGGKAQVCHRDYHLGFQSVDQLGQFPPNVHRLSAHLTLQGAIAHSPMPIASGPTQLLPYSQQFHPGYIATQLPEFRQHFLDNFVQLPLQTGDALFFNPAVFHAAGQNDTDQDRFANLFQIGSALGRTLELVDHAKLCRLLYPVLSQWRAAGGISVSAIDNILAATAKGYPFPCSLDVNPPIGGMAPASQYDMMRQALHTGESSDIFNARLDEWLSRQRSI